MANICRTLGINIFTHMQNAQISLESFAEQLGYSIKDAWNIVEGKLMLLPMELETIASFLGTTSEKLIITETKSLVPELQNRNEFTHPENLEKILELMDEYVELKEVV